MSSSLGRYGLAGGCFGRGSWCFGGTSEPPERAQVGVDPANAHGPVGDIRGRNIGFHKFLVGGFHSSHGDPVTRTRHECTSNFVVVG